jgi:hypothetical protein
VLSSELEDFVKTHLQISMQKFSQMVKEKRARFNNSGPKPKKIDNKLKRCWTGLKLIPETVVQTVEEMNNKLKKESDLKPVSTESRHFADVGFLKARFF